MVRLVDLISPRKLALRIKLQRYSPCAQARASNGAERLFLLYKPPPSWTSLNQRSLLCLPLIIFKPNLHTQRTFFLPTSPPQTQIINMDAFTKKTEQPAAGGAPAGQKDDYVDKGELPASSPHSVHPRNKKNKKLTITLQPSPWAPRSLATRSTRTQPRRSPTPAAAPSRSSPARRSTPRSPTRPLSPFCVWNRRERY